MKHPSSWAARLGPNQKIFGYILTKGTPKKNLLVKEKSRPKTYGFLLVSHLLSQSHLLNQPQKQASHSLPNLIALLCRSSLYGGPRRSWCRKLVILRRPATFLHEDHDDEGDQDLVLGQKYPAPKTARFGKREKTRPQTPKRPNPQNQPVPFSGFPFSRSVWAILLRWSFWETRVPWWITDKVSGSPPYLVTWKPKKILERFEALLANNMPSG